MKKPKITMEIKIFKELMKVAFIAGKNDLSEIEFNKNMKEFLKKAK